MKSMNLYVINVGPVRLFYEPYLFSEKIMFFSRNKSVNSTFNHDFSAKRTWPLPEMCPHDEGIMNVL